jgi:hypothetical protein
MKNSKTVEMSFKQLSRRIGTDNAFKIFDRAGKTEQNASARGFKVVKAKATVSVISDLVLTEPSEDIFNCTVSPLAQWFSFQVFVDMTSNDGAFAICNKNYPFPGSAPPSETCVIGAIGIVRAFTSDFDYTVHLSNTI